mmetsp:Transcript_11942/g.17112  ORF Transcript_11942/g.17112 Transcript_11942/m.17112 type:complete len:323 (-) Transcript_11942:86-1054(-)
MQFTQLMTIASFKSIVKLVFLLASSSIMVFPPVKVVSFPMLFSVPLLFWKLLSVSFPFLNPSSLTGSTSTVVALSSTTCSSCNHLNSYGSRRLVLASGNKSSVLSSSSPALSVVSEASKCIVVAPSLFIQLHETKLAKNGLTENLPTIDVFVAPVKVIPCMILSALPSPSSMCRAPPKTTHPSHVIVIFVAFKTIGEESRSSSKVVLVHKRIFSFPMLLSTVSTKVCQSNIQLSSDPVSFLLVWLELSIHITRLVVLVTSASLHSTSDVVLRSVWLSSMGHSSASKNWHSRVANAKVSVQTAAVVMFVEVPSSLVMLLLPIP